MKRKVNKEGFNVSAIYWTDSTGAEDMPREGLKPCNAVRIGIITDLTKDYVTLVGEIFEDGDQRVAQSIPMKMVKKIITLRSVAPSIKKVFNPK